MGESPMQHARRSMAMRANLTVMFGSVLVGFFLLISGSDPVYAHGGHDRGSKQPAAAQGASVKTAAIEASHATDDRVNGPAADGPTRIQAISAGVDLTRDAETPLSLSSVGCGWGTSSCQGGATLRAKIAPPGPGPAKRVRPPLVLGAARAVQTGSDRPPRQHTVA